MIYDFENDLYFDSLEEAKHYFEPTDFIDERDDVQLYTDSQFKTLYLEWLDYRKGIQTAETADELNSALNKYTDKFDSGRTYKLTVI